MFFYLLWLWTHSSYSASIQLFASISHFYSAYYGNYLAMHLAFNLINTPVLCKRKTHTYKTRLLLVIALVWASSKNMPKRKDHAAKGNKNLKQISLALLLSTSVLKKVRTLIVPHVPQRCELPIYYRHVSLQNACI